MAAAAILFLMEVRAEFLTAHPPASGDHYTPQP